jgi:hypothetical protein
MGYTRTSFSVSKMCIFLISHFIGQSVASHIFSFFTPLFSVFDFPLIFLSFPLIFFIFIISNSTILDRGVG